MIYTLFAWQRVFRMLFHDVRTFVERKIEWRDYGVLKNRDICWKRAVALPSEKKRNVEAAAVGTKR